MPTVMGAGTTLAFQRHPDRKGADETMAPMSQLLRKARIALLPRNSVLASRTLNGAVLLGMNRPGYGGRGAYLAGGEIEPELRILPLLLPAQGGVFIDVGANTGVYSLTVAQHWRGAGTVLALEPNPVILAMLARSCERNGFKNVRLRALAASERTGPLEFYANEGRPNQFSLERADGLATSSSVLSVTLDQLMAWEELDQVHFIKIDAEGSENRVLAGAGDTIARHRPVVLAEDFKVNLDFNEAGYESVKLPGSSNTLFMPREHRALNAVKHSAAAR